MEKKKIVLFQLGIVRESCLYILEAIWQSLSKIMIGLEAPQRDLSQGGSERLSRVFAFWDMFEVKYFWFALC